MDKKFYNEIKKYVRFSQDKDGKNCFCRNNLKEKSGEKCMYLNGTENFTCNLFLQDNDLYYRASGMSYEILRCKDCVKFFEEE